MAKNYIYIDESGDLGLSGKASKVLVISALISQCPKQLDRIITNARRNKFKKELAKAKEIKFNKSSQELKEWLIRKLNDANGCWATHCILIKEKVYSPYLKNDKNKLYNYVAGSIADNIKLDSYDVEVRIDKSKNKALLREDFNQYFEVKLRNGSNIRKLDIFHSHSKNFSGIQLADILAGSTYQKYNNSNSYFVDVINQKTFPNYFLELWK
ncbi:DUF3800 domain-containing protein [Oxyplasma meridianum]|uniref:DUF3800 domain-containing protein n=1 Tax=Oxyplasma meridianum TaxID=3073602 RepID=A0AAX4NFU9_9ARCH